MIVYVHKSYEMLIEFGASQSKTMEAFTLPVCQTFGIKCEYNIEIKRCSKMLIEFGASHSKTMEAFTLLVCQTFGIKCEVVSV